VKEIKNIVQYRPVSEIKELSNNPRTISKEDFDRLKDSIIDNPEYFEGRPLILSNRTGELVVLAGNQRLRAAKAVGLKEVPTIVLPNLTEEKEKEIIIRDNVSNGRWDMELLANDFDLQDLADWGVDVNIDAEFGNIKDRSEELGEDEINQILDSTGEIELSEMNDNIILTVRLPEEKYEVTVKAMREYDKNIGLVVLPEKKDEQ
jgi:hypothetical protein